jgi:hypothetical protein
MPNGTVTLLAWRIRLFHTQRRGLAEGWWIPETEKWKWSLQEIDPSAPEPHWREWHRAIVDVRAGRPKGSERPYFATANTFLTHCRGLVSDSGWADAALEVQGINARRQLRDKLRSGKFSQKDLAKVLGCGQRTLADKLKTYKECDHLTWRDVKQHVAKSSRER